MAKLAAKENKSQIVPSSMEDDARLMQRIATGDEAAFAHLLERHIGKALAFMTRMLSQRQDAEDEVQKAFTKVWQEAPTWRPEAKFSTWFYRVLMNQALDVLRARKPAVDIEQNDIADHAPSIEEHMIANDRSAAVQKALASLPERQRQALILCHYEELSQKDAAALLGISEGALESLLSRGRAALKQLISREWYN